MAEGREGRTPTGNDDAAAIAPTEAAPANAALGGTQRSLLAMTVCPTCGVATPVARYCTDCGASMAARRFCTSCGTPTKPGAPFCAACGAKSA